MAVFKAVLELDDINRIMTLGLERALGITAVYPAGKLTKTWSEIKIQN